MDRTFHFKCEDLFFEIFMEKREVKHNNLMTPSSWHLQQQSPPWSLHVLEQCPLFLIQSSQPPHKQPWAKIKRKKEKIEKDDFDLFSFLSIYLSIYFSFNMILS